MSALVINNLSDAYNLVIRAFRDAKNHDARLKLARIAEYLNAQSAELSSIFWRTR